MGCVSGVPWNRSNDVMHAVSVPCRSADVIFIDNVENVPTVQIVVVLVDNFAVNEGHLADDGCFKRIFNDLVLYIGE